MSYNIINTLNVLTLQSDYTLQGEEGVLQSEHWTMLGKAVQNFFKRPPTCTFL